MKFTTAPQIPAPTLTAMLAGQEIAGFSLSVTVTVWSQLAVFPALSVTAQVTVVVPAGNAAGALFVTEATPQLSAVTGVPRLTPVAVQPLFVVVLTATGQVIVGRILSVTVTV
jgi:hypothetical protein